MLDITIIAVGKIKEKYYLEAVNEYLKRSKPFARIKMVELEAESFNEAGRERAKNFEGARIIKHLDKLNNKKVIALDEHGLEYDSLRFAKRLSAVNQPIVFIVGGSLGLSDSVLKTADEKIGLSKMTFPHELARVALTEQIYRAITIINKKTYHN
jgi:23S rRNA (pseudouridine1915-N3)-methyltransferase